MFNKRIEKVYEFCYNTTCKVCRYKKNIELVRLAEECSNKKCRECENFEECRRTFGDYSPIDLCIYVPFLDGEEDEADV